MRRFLLTCAIGLVLLGACSVSTNDEPVALGSDLFEDLMTTTSTSSTTIPGARKEVPVYLLEEKGESVELVEVPRSVDVDAGVSQILGDLFRTPVDVEGDERPAERGLRTRIPETATLLEATIAPGTKTLVVDVSGLFGATGVIGNALRDALAQIVWTATQSDDVDAVSFLNDGSPVPAQIDDGETTDEPVQQSDYSRER